MQHPKIEKAPETVTVRRAAPCDIPALQRLLRQILDLHAKIRPDIFVAGTTKYKGGALEELLADEKRPVFVACLPDGTVAGHLFCVFRDPPESENIRPFRELYIDDLCVDERFRGTGIGRKLFDTAKRLAEENGCDMLTLNVWSGNSAAAAFYEKMGMTPQRTELELKLG